jgi:dipeptidyl aminopeptidase/acylaminoacyl peptidase
VHECAISRGASVTRWRVALLAGAALLVAACGSSSGGAATPAPPSAAAASAAEAPVAPAASALAAAPAGATTFQSVVLSDGTEIDFAVALPPDFDAEREWPTVLALPPGAQTTAMVEVGLDLYWAAGPPRGWVVIRPAAPGGQLFFEGSESLVGEFLDTVGRTYRPEGGTYHLVGVSNGGISAFRVATADPGRFRSLLVAPGFPLS